MPTNTNHPAYNPRHGTDALWLDAGFAGDFKESGRHAGLCSSTTIIRRIRAVRTTRGCCNPRPDGRPTPTNLRQMITDYVGANGTNIELVCTENNSVSSNPGKQSVSLVNGLFKVDSLAQLMQTEFNGLFWWDLRNGAEYRLAI